MYFSNNERYETEAEYRSRIRQDAVKMTEKLKTNAGVNARVFVWPYGAANGIAIEELKNWVMTCLFTLSPTGKYFPVRFYSARINRQ